MTVLFGPAFKPLAQRGRDFGLAFAAAHLIHIGLVVRLYGVSARPPISDQGFLFFGIAILWTYILALFSVEWLSRLLSRTGGGSYVTSASNTSRSRSRSAGVRELQLNSAAGEGAPSINRASMRAIDVVV
jgi:hypothetical protein